VLRWRHVLGLVVLEVALFVIAGVTSKSNHHPGTVSNVFWGAFLVGVVLLILLVLATGVRSLRRTKAS